MTRASHLPVYETRYGLVETATAGWVHWFNTRRLHSSIDYLPPVTYEQLYRQQTSTPTGKAA